MLLFRKYKKSTEITAVTSIFQRLALTLDYIRYQNIETCPFIQLNDMCAPEKVSNMDQVKWAANTLPLYMKNFKPMTNLACYTIGIFYI